MDIATDTGLNVDIADSRFSGWAMAPTIRGDFAVVPDHRDFVRPAPAPAGHNGTISSVDQPQEQVNGSGDGIGSPHRVLFLAERLSLKWNQIHSIGAGLKNMGNTCFLNSALQCLTYTAPFTNYMLTQEHSRTCFEPGFCMMCTMENHIIHVFANSGNVIKPIGVLSKLQKIAEHFQYGKQEDAHEFLRYILDTMQQCCLPENISDRQTQTTTFIHQVFGGYLRSRVECSNCKAVSDSFDPFLDISLEIENAFSISDALEQFVKPEQLGGENAYKCSKCSQMVTAKKGFSIHRSCNVLTLSLKRFSVFSGEKILKSQGEPQVYDLYAVLVHSGFSCHTGHYFCYIKGSNGQWYQMNDSCVSVCDIRTVLSQQAYVLFYIKCNDGEKTAYESRASSRPDFAPQRVMIPRINISLHYGNAGHMGAKLPPYSGCPVRTHFDRRNKIKEVCGKSLEVTGCDAKAPHRGNRPNGLILGGAKPTMKGYHPGSHKAVHFFPDSKADRGGFKRVCPCPYRDGPPHNCSHRLFSLKCRREKTLGNLSGRHHTHHQHHRLRDELGCKEHAYPCNVGPCDPCKPKKGSLEPLVAEEKSNGSDGGGVHGGVSFLDRESETTAAAEG
ncbi:ubiquitin carboxyl-terminal hydrolase 17-like protein 6 isoform X2 [Nelusetta ayraudi]|uniref:ubiquitin carboxyl-terminal hydrolase 17-like protein 6 isoform X2 n=1 Tax=Nelusetta ayraudi TaxID=303726 RepID=UPI003F72A92D